MENPETPRNPFAEFRSRINLYSYICQVSFVLFDLLIGGVSLLIAHEAGLNLVYLWVAFGAAIFSLVLVAVLSALYFAGDDEERNSPGRIKAALIIRMILRIIGLVIMGCFFLHLNLVSTGETGWSGFLYVYAVLGTIVSGLSTLYAIWKLSWIKQNPGRYQPYSGLGTPHQPVKTESNEKDFTKPSGKTAKKDKKQEIVEVEVHDKKD